VKFQIIQAGYGGVHTGTTTDTAKVTVPMPVLKNNSQVRVLVYVAQTGNTNMKALNVRYGGASVGGTYDTTESQAIALRGEFTIQNKNSLTAQATTFAIGERSFTYLSDNDIAVNSGVAQNLTINLQLGNVADQQEILHYSVEVANP
jgi:hypothetical protein